MYIYMHFVFYFILFYFIYSILFIDVIIFIFYYSSLERCFFIIRILYIFKWPINLVGRVSVNGLGALHSIPSWIKPKSQMKLIPPCFTYSIIRYGSTLNWSNLWKEVAPSPTPQCSSYWKGSYRISLDYGHQLYFFFTYIF